MACNCGPTARSPTKMQDGPCGLKPPCTGDMQPSCQPCTQPDSPCECREPAPCNTEPCTVPPCVVPSPMLPCPPTCDSPSPQSSPIPPQQPSPTPAQKARSPQQPPPPPVKPESPTPQPHPPPYCPVPLCTCLDEPDYDRHICSGPCKTPCSLLDYATARWNCTTPDMCAILNPSCYKYCERFASIYQKDFCHCLPCGTRDVCIIQRPKRYDCLPLGQYCGPKFEYLPHGKCKPRTWGTGLHGGSGGGPKANPCYAKARSHGIMGPPPSRYSVECSEYQERHSRLGSMILNYGKRACTPRVPTGYPCIPPRPVSPCGNALPRTHCHPTWLQR